MRKLAGLAGAIVLAAAAGACSSSGSSASAQATATPKSGTETITGTATGAAAANWLNSGGKTQLQVPSLVFTGPVDTTISGRLARLDSGSAKTNTHTFVTPAGNLTIQRASSTSESQPAVVGKSGSTCYFKETGTYSYTVVGSQSTGKFAGAAGSGTITSTVVLGADLLPGKTTCSVDNVGSNGIAKGASITFKASGPLTLKQ
jgi:hypothetical protein